MKVIVWNVNRAAASRRTTWDFLLGEGPDVAQHQLDYCYVNAPVLEWLNRACVPSQEQVFGPTPRLSDHLPIVCDFD